MGGRAFSVKILFIDLERGSECGSQGAAVGRGWNLRPTPPWSMSTEPEVGLDSMTPRS